MNMILILSISILLCSVLSEALVCQVCKIYKKGLGCTEGKATCKAEQGQKCKTVKIFKENVRNFYRKGCTNPKDKCEIIKQDPKFGTVTTTCCNDSDLCNKKLIK